MSTMTAAALTDPSTGGRLVSADGRTLPFRGSDLEVDACTGLARVVLRQRFHNPHAEPLRVTWQVPLPADAAVSGFSFTFAGQRVVGEVDRKAAARERFEQALVEGRTAAILEQDRSSLFTQEVGNLPPGAELTCELVLDQPLRWLSEGSWEWRFPTTVAPRYLGTPKRVSDAERVIVDVSEDPLAPRVRLDLRLRDALRGEPTSPSHALAVQPEAGDTLVGLRAEDGARLDRDVVVRWPVAAPEVGLALDVGRPPAGHPRAGSAFGRLVLVPAAAARPSVARDLVVLLDTSGSMGGEPLRQAQAVVCALIDTLHEGDSLELIAFSMRPERWRAEPVPATAVARAAASKWVRALRAGGGTEMRAGILEALRSLRADAQRQVVLVTDGLIGFEAEIVAAIRDRLPRGCRVHTVGIGSSVNRSLTASAARAGAGVEAVVALGEDPAEAARRLVAHTAAPRVVDLSVQGPAVRGTAARALPDLFGGAPAVLPVEIAPEGGEILVRGRLPEGPWEQRVAVPAVAEGQGSAALATTFARERVEDLEVAGAAGEEVDAQVERLGLDFQVATRLTSWVAVSEAPTVDPGAPTRRERIPHEIPHGTSVEGFGLRAPMAQRVAGAAAPTGAPRARMMMRPPAPRAEAPRAKKSMRSVFDGLVDFLGGGGREDEERELPMAQDTPEAYAEAPERAWCGRLVLRRGDEAVVEVSIDAPATWRPGTEVEVELEDGTWVTARLDLARSTRVGPVSAGQAVRLVLRLDASIAAPRVVRLQSAGERWVIHL